MDAQTEKIHLCEANGASAVLAWMPELKALASSAVVHRVAIPKEVSSSFSSMDWLNPFESILRQRKIPLSRIYVDDDETFSSSLQQQLLASGYVKRCEVALLGRHPKPEFQPMHDLRLEPVVTDADWKEKLFFHLDTSDGPDGYTNPANLWVEMERRKCQSMTTKSNGYGNQGGSLMQAFLVRRNCDNVIVATIAAIVENDLVRFKNVVVSPCYRRQGIGLCTIHLIWKWAETKYPAHRVGLFAVEDGISERLYRRAGMYPIACQYEWTRPLLGTAQM